MSRINEIKEKMVTLQEMNQKYLNEISSLMQNRTSSSEIQLISYFTYSVSLAHAKNGENFCLGSYHMYNISGKPINEPYICLKLTPNSPFEFTGKYLYQDTKQKMKFSNAWERINDSDNKDEYWLRPYNIQQLDPYQKLTFSDFQIKWTSTTNYSGSVMGFSYCDEIQKGVPSLNQINLSGKVNEEEHHESSS